MREKGMEWLAGVWSLDTPAGRAALNRLVVLGDAQYGGGSHWIEARGNVDLGRDLPPVAGI